MRPQYLTMIGLGLDIIGGFLVAVEAIKIENLRALRDRVLKRASAYILGPRIQPQRNLVSDLVILKDKSYIKDAQKNESEEPLPAMGCIPLLTMHVVVGFIVILILNEFLDRMIYTICLSAVVQLSNLFQAIILLIFIVVGVPLLGAIGSAVFSSLFYTLILIMKAIDIIEAKTPNGTVGIIGFLLLAVGFLFQFVATFLTLK